MYVCRVELVVLVIVVLVQMQCTAHQTRPLLPENVTDSAIDKGQKARVLMVLQNHKALECVNNPIVEQHNFDPLHLWTIWNFLLGPNTGDLEEWAKHCQQPKLKCTFRPESEELYDKIWPDIFEDKNENREHVLINWKKEGPCVKDYYTPYTINTHNKRKQKNCISEEAPGKTPDLAYCYYKQAQLLFDRGIRSPASKINNDTVPIPTTSGLTLTASSNPNVAVYLHTVLLDMFTKERESDQGYIINGLQQLTVQDYFNNHTAPLNVNPYLGCQYRNNMKDICYLTRVGLCFLCNVKDSGGPYTPYPCTPPYNDDTNPPGRFTNCISSSDNMFIPWNSDHEGSISQDMSCYDDVKCPKVRYTPPEENISCDPNTEQS